MYKTGLCHMNRESQVRFWYFSSLFVSSCIVLPDSKWEETLFCIKPSTSNKCYILKKKKKRKVGINSSLKAWQKSPVKPSDPGLLFVGRFLITISISLLVIGLFIFSICSWFSLGRLYLRICPFLLDCPFYCHRVTCSHLLQSFVFLCCPL